MVKYQTPRSLHTLQLSPPAPAPPIPAHTSPPKLLSLLLSLPPYVIFTSVPNLLPIASPRGTFALGGCSLHICHTSSFLLFLHAALLPSLAMPLYLDSPIGHIPSPHIPNTSLTALFPYKGMPHFLPPFSCTLCLVGAQTCCPLPLTSSSSPPVFPSAYNGRLGGQTIHTCDTCGCLSFLSSSQCIPGYRALLLL